MFLTFADRSHDLSVGNLLELMDNKQLYHVRISQRYVDCTVLGAGSVPDAEDSSYDSDYEAEDSTTPATATTATAAVPRPRSESQVSPVAHPDVSRTTSDTLAAEFAEYVTIQGPSPTQSPGTNIRVLFNFS